MLTPLKSLKEKLEEKALLDAEIAELEGDKKVKIKRTSLKGSKNPKKGK